MLIVLARLTQRNKNKKSPFRSPVVLHTQQHNRTDQITSQALLASSSKYITGVVSQLQSLQHRRCYPAPASTSQALLSSSSKNITCVVSQLQSLQHRCCYPAPARTSQALLASSSQYSTGIVSRPVNTFAVRLRSIGRDTIQSVLEGRSDCMTFQTKMLAKPPLLTRYLLACRRLT
jgi:hypothetical protein